MKKLTNIVLAIIILVFAGGCSSYQLVTLKSSIPNPNLEGYEFENDTIKVTYSFRGENCPVSIVVYNKFSKPIYVDWSKSAAIIDGNKLSYWKNTATLKATSDESHGYFTTTSEINGNIYKDDRISFIPPKSYVTLVPLKLRYTPFNINNYQSSSKIVLQRNYGTSKGTLYSFDDNSSPFKFRSFLTYSASQDISDPMYLDHIFWVSDITQTMVAPEYLAAIPSNQFYMSKPTENGGIGALVVIGVIVTVLALK